MYHRLERENALYARLLTTFRLFPLEFRSCLLFVGVLSAWFGSPQITFAVEPGDLTLPVYEIFVDEEDLEHVLDNYLDEIDIEATMVYNGHEFDGIFAIRGATSRHYPKKSWRFRYTTPSPDGTRDLNWDAAYRDNSLCRNYLAMRLARRVSMPASDVRHVSLFVNGEFFGVFVETEDVDDRFFERRHLPTDRFRIKGIRHGARFVPFFESDKFDYNYDIKQATEAELDTFLTRNQLLQYSSPESIMIHLPHMFNANNFLRYFALNFVITNYDGFSKNFIAFESFDRRYDVIPWDMDASFGNDWQGIWRPVFSSAYYYTTLQHNALYGRLMEQEMFRNLFEEDIHFFAEDSFPWLDTVIDSVYEEIRHDVEYDDHIRCSFNEFLSERDSLHVFLERRADYIRDRLHLTPKTTILEWNVDRDYLASTDTEVTFRARVEEDDGYVQLWMTDLENEIAFNMTEEDDLDDDDEWYSVTVSPDELSLPVYYCFYTYGEDGVKFPTPASGGYYYPYTISQIPSLRSSTHAPSESNIRIGPCWIDETSGEKIVSLINDSDSPVSLAGCFVSTDSKVNRWVFSSDEMLDGGDTIFVAQNPSRELAERPWRHVEGRFSGFPEQGESLLLCTASGVEILSEPVVYIPAMEQVNQAVINEINYNGRSGQDPGDWIELYFRKDVQDVTGWYLCDERVDHCWMLPDESFDMAASNGYYVVLATDTAAFRRYFPSVDNVVGNVSFSLGNSGDHVRLFNDQDHLVDIVCYTDDPPWPTGCDGSGLTLELDATNLPNRGPEHWHSSLLCCPLGTPGKINSIADTSNGDTTSNRNTYSILYITPNPFDSQCTVTIETPDHGFVTIQMFNILGQEVAAAEKICV